MHCPAYHSANPAEAYVCLHCGTRLVRLCLQCQCVSPPEARFCMACGWALPVTSPPIAPPASGTLQTVARQDSVAARAHQAQALVRFEQSLVTYGIQRVGPLPRRVHHALVRCLSVVPLLVTAIACVAEARRALSR
jgi:hypothetical protein